MKPTKIADGIYDVGVIDWNIRDFHGYSTDRGTSYNAYLVMDEKVALIDTVKAPFADQLIDNISQIIDPKNRCGHQQPHRNGSLGRAAAHHARGWAKTNPCIAPRWVPGTWPAISPTPGTITPSRRARNSLWASAPSPSWKPA
jgi:hypothetical protein